MTFKKFAHKRRLCRMTTQAMHLRGRQRFLEEQLHMCCCCESAGTLEQLRKLAMEQKAHARALSLLRR